MKKIIKKVEPIKVDAYEEIVKMLMDKIPGLFDRFPQGSLSRGSVEKLAEEIIKLK